MYAVMRVAGKQYRVEQGSVVKIDQHLPINDGKVSFNEVLLVGGTDGAAARIGSPLLDGVTINGTVITQGKDDKVIVTAVKMVIVNRSLLLKLNPLPHRLRK
jgi:large subunit ribosomal protein L21